MAANLCDDDDGALPCKLQRRLSRALQLQSANAGGQQMATHGADAIYVSRGRCSSWLRSYSHEFRNAKILIRQLTFSLDSSLITGSCLFCLCIYRISRLLRFPQLKFPIPTGGARSTSLPRYDQPIPVIVHIPSYTMARNILQSSIQNASFSIIFQVSGSSGQYKCRQDPRKPLLFRSSVDVSRSASMHSSSGEWATMPWAS